MYQGTPTNDIVQKHKREKHRNRLGSYSYNRRTRGFIPCFFCSPAVMLPFRDIVGWTSEKLCEPTHNATLGACNYKANVRTYIRDQSIRAPMRWTRGGLRGNASGETPSSPLHRELRPQDACPVLVSSLPADRVVSRSYRYRKKSPYPSPIRILPPRRDRPIPATSSLNVDYKGKED
jgi:hypothetical protein